MSEQNWQYNENNDTEKVERSYALDKILSKSKNLKASLKVRYLISKLEKSFSGKKFMTQNK